MIFLIFFLGAIFGSFSYCIGSRIILDKSIFGRSKCDFCNYFLSFYNLIPIFSFILQKGKCKKCLNNINIFHFIFEIFSGIFFALFFLKYNFDLIFFSLIFLIFIALLIQSASDLTSMMTYDLLSYFIGFLVILLSIYLGNSLIKILHRIVLMFLFLQIIKIFYLKIKKINALGDGDVILLCSLAPIMNLAFFSFFSFFLGLIGVSFGFIFNKFNFSLKYKFPFFPSISLAFLFAFLIFY